MKRKIIIAFLLLYFLLNFSISGVADTEKVYAQKGIIEIEGGCMRLSNLQPKLWSYKGNQI